MKKLIPALYGLAVWLVCLAIATQYPSLGYWETTDYALRWGWAVIFSLAGTLVIMTGVHLLLMQLRMPSLSWLGQAVGFFAAYGSITAVFWWSIQTLPKPSLAADNVGTSSDVVQALNHMGMGSDIVAASSIAALVLSLIGFVVLTTKEA